MAKRKLTIDIDVNDRGAVRALNRSEAGLQKLAAASRRASTGLASTQQGMASSGVSAAALGAKVFAAVGALQLASKAAGFVKDSAIGMNATLETTTLQFTTLMGSADRAETHVRSLFEFAKKTPFESGPIIEASRLMRTFGGDTLDTTANLTLIGNAAAATSAPINELGMWTGRLFAALEAGKPFGEAAQRLGELAVLTPQARMRMEALQASGASATEVFSVFRDELGKFDGAMEAQAETFAGLTSTMAENAKLFIAERATPIFEALKGAIKAVNSGFEAMNAGPVERAADQLNKLRLRQAALVDQINRQVRAMGFAEQRLLDQAKARQTLINTVTDQIFAQHQAETATDDETAAVQTSNATIETAAQKRARLAEAMEQQAAIGRELLALELQLDVALRQGTLAVNDQWLAIGTLTDVGKGGVDELGNLTSRAIDLGLVGLPTAQRGFAALHGEMNPPGGFFSGIMSSWNDIKSGLTGDNGISGFFNGIGAGVVEGFGNILSGGISSLISVGLNLAVKGLLEIGKAIANGLKAIGRGIGGFFKRIFGLGRDPLTPEQIAQIQADERARIERDGGITVNTPSTGEIFIPVPSASDFQQSGETFRLGDNTFSVPTLPQLASGGVVTRPTLAMIGEAGPEAVVPLSGGGFGATINITINGGMFDTPAGARRVTKMVADRITREMSHRRVLGGRV